MHLREVACFVQLWHWLKRSNMKAKYAYRTSCGTSEQEESLHSQIWLVHYFANNTNILLLFLLKDYFAMISFFFVSLFIGKKNVTYEVSIIYEGASYIFITWFRRLFLESFTVDILLNWVLFTIVDQVSSWIIFSLKSIARSRITS